MARILVVGLEELQAGIIRQTAPEDQVIRERNAAEALKHFSPADFYLVFCLFNDLKEPDLLCRIRKNNSNVYFVNLVADEDEAAQRSAHAHPRKGTPPLTPCARERQSLRPMASNCGHDEAGMRRR